MSTPHHWIVTLVCDDRPGIVHAVTGAIVEAEGGQGRNIQAFGPAFTRGVLGTGVGVGLRKQDQDLKRAFETAIGEATRDGTIARISTQWFGYDISIRN